MSRALKSEEAAVAGAAIFRLLVGSSEALTAGLSLGDIQEQLPEFDRDRLDDIVWALVEAELVRHNNGFFNAQFKTPRSV